MAKVWRPSPADLNLVKSRIGAHPVYYRHMDKKKRTAVDAIRLAAGMIDEFIYVGNMAMHCAYLLHHKYKGNSRASELFELIIELSNTVSGGVGGGGVGGDMQLTRLCRERRSRRSHRRRRHRRHRRRSR